MDNIIHENFDDPSLQLLEEEFVLNVVANKYEPETIFSKEDLENWAIKNGFKKIDCNMSVEGLC